ncbi:MAG TPA: hypothetical protein VIV83_10195 [Gemmatimonadales bacterium]|jgi:hypothetical protein
MFRMMLFTQWKWSRQILLPAVLAAFVLPIWSVQHAGDPNQSWWEARQLLASVETWAVAYPALATAVALAMAMTAWGADHRGRHVYALSLPVPRWHYALQRFGAGAVLLAVPVIALWIGAMIAAGAATIPAGLHTYAGALALRFGLAAAVAYAIFFAITAGTTRTAGYVLAIIGGLIAVQILTAAAGLEIRIIPFVGDRLLLWPGPLEIFSGRWMLIDV